MGVCTSGDIQIELQTIEDAEFVYAKMEKIEDLTMTRLDTKVASFNLHDNHLDGTTFDCNVYADRIPNGEFQIEQVIEQIKVWVKEKKIFPPYSFTGELLVQQAGWSMGENEWEDEG